MKPKQEHRIMSTIWGGDLCCFRCGARFPLSKCLPQPISFLGRLSRAFNAEHRCCAKRPAGEALRREHEAAAREYEQKTGKPITGFEMEVR